MILKELLKQLDFSDVGVNVAAAQQPTLFRYAARRRIRALRQLNEAKNRYKVESAVVAQKIRHEARVNGDKMTEGALEELLFLDDKVQALLAAQNRAEEDDEGSKLLLEAFRMRRDAIKVVADMARTEDILYQQESIGKQLAAKYPGGEA